MKNYKNWLIIANLIAILVYFHFSISEKEQLIKKGKLILLELAPVDPRSLMQGDYMSLRYKISEPLSTDSMAKRGFCVVTLDSTGVAQRVRFQQNSAPKSTNEFLLRYRSVSSQNINIGTESYFFEEGQAEKYAKAKFGGLRVDEHGNSLLVGLYDEHRRKIE